MVSDGENQGSTFYFELPLFMKEDLPMIPPIDDNAVSVPVLKPQRASSNNLSGPAVNFSLSKTQVLPATSTLGEESLQTNLTRRLGSLPLRQSFFSSLTLRQSFSSLGRLSNNFASDTSTGRHTRLLDMQENLHANQFDAFENQQDEETGSIWQRELARSSSSVRSLQGISIMPESNAISESIVSFSRTSQLKGSAAAAGRRKFLLDQLQSPDSIVSFGQVDGINSPTRGLRVMIVDDTASTRKIVIKLLAGLGHKVEEASDGLQFLHKMGILQSDDYEESSAAVRSGYDFILMDDNMPKMCGPDATAAARSAGYTGLIFGLTGNTDCAQLEAFMTKGADVVFTKPLDLKKLQETIRLKLPGRGGL